MLARFILAKAALLGWGPGPDTRRMLEAMAGGPVPPAPPGLVSMDNSHGEAPWLSREHEKLAALHLDEPELKARRAALQTELRERRRAWIATVTDLPDFDALEAEARGALPPPISLDITLGELLGNSLDLIERELLGGMTSQEAEAEAHRKFDASREAADRERAAAASAR